MLPESNFEAVVSMQDPREEFGPPGGDDDGGGVGNNSTTKEDNTDVTHIKIGEKKLDHPSSIIIKSEPEDHVELRPVWEDNIKYPTAKVEDCNEDFPPATPGYLTPDCSEWPTAVQLTAPVSPPKRKASRGRKRGQWKLRFHHQALPPEYLDHYEASQNAAASKSIEKKSDKPLKPELSPMPSITEATGESVRNWLQRMTAMQQDSNAVQAAAAMETDRESPESERKRRPISRVVNYSDLPYMGEMTLDNSKPRRGRKPKKADICHLIYKNYGTIFPGTPKGLMEDEKKSSRNLRSENVASAAQSAAARRTDVQHRIISSLLEKRLTQESRLAQTKVQLQAKVPTVENEPLNLCVRDLNLRVTPPSPSSSSEDDIQILRDSPISTTPRVTSTETDQMLVNNLKIALPQFDSSLLMHKKTGSPDTAHSSISGSDATTGASGYVYWPGANVFMHPMALYYHKMAAAASSASGKSSPSSPTIPSPLTPPSREHQRILIPKQMSQLMDSDKQTETTSVSPSAKVVATPPVKRKRSAIFIPPMPTENNTNPATEVSICKFKFTGGAKPSLQEKKMLSVDSGGNFRYYSGTGDKSMRGYEFFPRESLQQQAGKAGSSNSGLFLNASGEKVCTSSIENPGQVTNTMPVEVPVPVPLPVSTNHTQSRQSDSSRRKRKSRRSLQREKLEQTFKEKGFLIQTQQLESAEGATYCKFRQLRKFTRYLFRSWKDYLPGELQGMPGNPEMEIGNPNMPSSSLTPVPQDGALSASPSSL